MCAILIYTIYLYYAFNGFLLLWAKMGPNGFAWLARWFWDVFLYVFFCQFVLHCFVLEARCLLFICVPNIFAGCLGRKRLRCVLQNVCLPRIFAFAMLIWFATVGLPCICTISVCVRLQSVSSSANPTWCDFSPAVWDLHRPRLHIFLLSALLW